MNRKDAPIVRPKLPEYPNPSPRCPVCGEEVREGQAYEVSKRSKYITVYAHSACLRKSENTDNGVRIK